MIDFWIFPLSTIWGAYQIQGLQRFYFYSTVKDWIIAQLSGKIQVIFRTLLSPRQSY